MSVVTSSERRVDAVSFVNNLFDAKFYISTVVYSVAIVMASEEE